MDSGFLIVTILWSHWSPCVCRCFGYSGGVGAWPDFVPLWGDLCQRQEYRDAHSNNNNIPTVDDGDTGGSRNELVAIFIGMVATTMNATMTLES